MFLGNQSSTGSADEDVATTFGDLSGNITDAQTGNAISGAALYISGFQASTSESSSGTGTYLINDAPAGSRSLVISKSSYVSQTVDVTIPENTEKENFNVVLVPDGFGADKYVITLSWGDTPADLDSHLYVPAAVTYEVYYPPSNDGDLTASPWAQLDVDDTDGGGPETIRIRNNNGSLDFNGTYRYFVRNFSGTPGFSESDAVVRVYKDEALFRTYEACTGDDTLDYWHVFDINGATGQFSPGSSTCEASKPSDPN